MAWATVVVSALVVVVIWLVPLTTVVVSDADTLDTSMLGASVVPSAAEVLDTIEVCVVGAMAVSVLGACAAV